MARIPSYQRKQLPSTNVGAAPMPMSAANVAGDAFGKGLQAFGGGVSNLGESIFKIKQMDDSNKDALATTEYDNIIKDATRKHQLFMEKEGDETKWEDNRKQVFDMEAASKISQLRWGTSRAKGAADLTTSGLLKNSMQTTELAAIKKRKIEALAVTESDYIAAHSAIITPGMTQLEIEEIENRKTSTEMSFREILKHSYGPELIEKTIKGSDIDSLKGQAINHAIAGDFEKARKIINNIPFQDPKNRVAMMNSIDAMEAKTIVNNKVAIEKELAEIDNIIILPQDEFLAAVPETLDRINKSTILPVKGENGAGKEGQRKKINDRVKAIVEDKTDPLYEFDPVYYKQLNDRISANPRIVSESEINNAAGKGTNKGITAGINGQQGALIKLKRFLEDSETDQRLYNEYSRSISTLKATKAFHQSTKRNDVLAQEAQVLLMKWAATDNRSPADYQQFYDGIIDVVGLTNKGLWLSGVAEEQRLASEGMKDFAMSMGMEDFSDEEIPTISKGDVTAYRKLKKGTKYKDYKGNISTK